jgi:hypothetical protein
MPGDDEAEETEQDKNSSEHDGEFCHATTAFRL